MRKTLILALLSALIILACLLVLNSCGGGSASSTSSQPPPPPPPPPPGPTIKHIVVIFQENRTTDNLFHDPILIQRGADIAQTGQNTLGQTVTLWPGPMVNDYDLDHSHSAFNTMYHKGKMDGANLVTAECTKTAVNCPPPNAQYAYVQASDVQPYFQLAEQYTFGDHMFQTNQGPSFPAHQFLISGTSAPTATSNLFAASNANSDTYGCIAPPGTWVYVVGPTGQGVSQMYPCFEHQSLTDLLNTAGISWHYYTPSAGSLWTGPNAIQHMCQPQTVSGVLTCTGTDWTNVVIPQTKVLTDIANHNLAQVNWVIPSGQASDHPVNTDGSGPSWVASVVNAIGNSAYWADTAIFITWDDWGGWFDHVAPTVIADSTSWGSGYVYGFRVPLIVVSPYAKPGYISHATHDFGSLLKFTEVTFHLGSLGYADAKSDDLSDCFDFKQTPLVFHTVSAPLDASHFLNDPRPPTDPDND